MTDFVWSPWGRYSTKCVCIEELHEQWRKSAKIEKIQTAAIRLSGRMGYHSEKLYEVSSAYYQFIMGTATKYDVHKRLVAKGYVVYKKGDDGVD